MLAHRRRRRAQPAVDGREPERQRRRRHRAHHRMVDLLVEPPCLQLRMVVHARGIAPDRGRDTVRDRAARRTRSTSRVGAPRAEPLVELVVPGAPADVRRELRVGRPPRVARAPRPDPRHCSSVATETASHVSSSRPRYRPCGATCGLRLPSRSSRLPYAVASSTSSAAALSAPSTIVTSSRLPTPVASRSASPTMSANAACMPALGSLGPRWMRGWSSRWPVIHARPVTCSMVCAKPDVVAPRSRQPERGHAHQEAARVDRVDRFPPEPEVAEHARREVLEHRVALRDEPPQEREPVVGSEVEGEAALVGVRAEVVRAALPPRTVHAGGAAPVARMPSIRLTDSTWMTSAPSAASAPAAIGPAHHAVRSSTRTPASGSAGSSPVIVRARRRVRLDRAGVLAQARRGPRRRRVLVVHPPRSARHREGSRRVVDEDPDARRSGRTRGCWPDRAPARPGCAARWRDGRSPRWCAASSTRGRARSTRPSASGGPSWALNSSSAMRSGRSMSRRKLWNCSRLFVQNPT